MQNSRGKEQTQQGADLIKQEVVLRLRLANDTMLLIKEKKDWSSLYKKKPNTIYGNFSKSKRCKIAKSVDFDNSENLEKISLNPYDAKTISMEKNNTTISSIDSNDSQQHNNSITIYKTENNIKSFMNSMRIRKMYNRTTQDRRSRL